MTKSASLSLSCRLRDRRAMLSLQAVVQVERCAAGQPLQESLNLQVVESLARSQASCASRSFAL